MITVISPAKTLDFTSPSISSKYTIPLYLEQSQKIINKLQRTPKKELKNLMSISDALVELNHQRYLDWHSNFDSKTEKTAIEAFKGDVYLGLEVENFDQNDFDFSQEHLRILSGLHGVLKPLDLIKPYRLEMGTKLKVGRANNLYQFWTDMVSQTVQNDIHSSESPYLINLASNEYFSVIDTKKINATVISPQFKDYSDGKLKVISFFAKKARGTMAAYIIKNKINKPDDLKAFTGMNYAFNQELSDKNNWIFTRQKP